MSAWHKGMRRCACVHVEGRFTAEPKWHVGPDHPAHGTLSLSVGLLLRSVAPVVIAVHVATRQVHPRLLVLQRGQGTAALHAGEGEGVETYGALGPSCIDLLPESLQVLLGGSVKETFCSAPQQGSSA